MTTLLKVDGISKSFGGLRAVNGVSFTVEEQAITSLIGPNGAGKTTVFNVVSGFLPTDTGRIEFRGRPIHALRPFEVARRGVGRTFQDPRVFPEMSVLNNVVVGLRQRGDHPHWALFDGGRMVGQRKKAIERAERMLATVGLLERARDIARDLSFGEQRFLSIARTLVSDPHLILMDEPTVGLDKGSLERLLALMQRLSGVPERAILVIEHNMDVVMTVSKKVVLLVQGAVVASGTPDEIKQNKSMNEAYLGRADAVARQ
ncbi:MAG: ABC transporter ATP-binding protein [Alphaproteobacteria bacterium]